MTTITEADVEQAALAWLSDLGWQIAHGPDIAPDTSNAERDDYGQVVLERRLRNAISPWNYCKSCYGVKYPHDAATMWYRPDHSPSFLSELCSVTRTAP
jgi:hypothetical protein